MEPIDGEPDHNVFVSEDLIPQSPLKHSIVESLFSDQLNPPLQLQTNQAKCGGQLWPAGVVLAEYLMREKLEDLRSKTVVELGAGSGLVGLAIALKLHQSPPPHRLNPTSITLTDGVSALLPLLQQNIDLNFLESTQEVAVKAQLISWGESSEERSSRQPDVILAADCAYIEESFPLLVNTLRDLVGEQTTLWFCYKKRRKRDRDCIKLIGKVFDVQSVRGEWERDGVWLFVVKRRPGKPMVIPGRNG